MPAKRMTLEQKIRLIRQKEQNPSWTRDELRLWAMPKFKLAELPAPKTISRVLQMKDELLLEYKRKQFLGLVPSARMSYERKLALVRKKEKNPDWKPKDLARWAKTCFKLAVEPSENSIARILEQKEHLVERQEQGQNMAVKSSRSANFPQLEKELVQWVHQQEATTGKRVQGNAIQEKAHELWTLMAPTNEDEPEVACFSNGWLDGFKRRHGLVNKRKITKKKLAAMEALLKTKTPGRKPAFPEVEAQLYEWIREQQGVSDKRIIGNDIKEKARELLAASGQQVDKQVTFSNGWLDGFRKRYGLIRERKPSSISTNNKRSQLEVHSESKKPRRSSKSLAEIESQVFNWIREQELIHHGLHVSDHNIKQKARELLAANGRQRETDEVCSGAWLDDFKRRYRMAGHTELQYDRVAGHTRVPPVPSLAPMEPVIALAELAAPSPMAGSSFGLQTRLTRCQCDHFHADGKKKEVVMRWNSCIGTENDDEVSNNYHCCSKHVRVFVSR